MAAIAVRSHCDYNRDNGSLEQKTMPRKIGLDDGVGYISTEWMRRCARSCRGRDLALEKTTPVETSCLQPSEASRYISEILSSGGPESTFLSHTEPPPSYYESIADLPPSYDLGEDLISTQLASKRLKLPPAYDYTPQSIILPPEPMTAPDVDFGDTSNFRQAAGKKAKKAARQASQAKWADGDDGGSKDGGDGEENGEGGGGGSNGGGGGAGDGGWGGDDWDAWDTGKKNKKGKKAKEEEKKKQEEEEAKKMEKEATNNDNPLSWADEVNDDGHDWGGFTTTTKKVKKGKKGNADPVPEKTNGIGYFDNISLNDAPKIDLDFGTKDKKDSSIGGFSGWNSSGWNTGGNWSFGAGADAGSTDIADSFSKTTKDSMDTADTASSWSFGGNKKNKKKTTTPGFDFGDFGVLEEKEEDKAGEKKIGGDDDWGTFGSAGRKDKNKKKSAFEDTTINPDLATIGTAVAEPDPVAEDTWGGGCGTSTTKKRKGKKGEEETPHPPPPPPAVSEPAAADEWGGSGIKKNKKGGKKITEVEERAIATVPDPDPEADTGWGSSGKKDKKKGKKEADKTEKAAVTALPEVEQELDLDIGWGGFGKKDKKGAKKEEPAEEPITVVPEPEAEPEAEPGLSFGWGTLSTKKEKKKAGKKDKKVEEDAAIVGPEPEADGGWGSFGTKNKKKGANKAVEPAFTKEVEPDPKPDNEWGAFSTKKDKKKTKKSAWDESEKEENSIVEGTSEPDTTADTGWGTFGTKTSKKAIRKSIWNESETEERPIVKETPEPDTTADIGWVSFGSKKDKQKGKKDDIPPPSLDPEPVIGEKPSLARTGSKKDKKGKKSLISEVNEDPVPAADSKFAADATSVAADDDWMSGWGAADKKKDKKNKRNSIASSTKEEAPPPPPPVPDIPDVSSDIWSSAKKATKGKKGKVTGPDPVVEATPDPVDTKDILGDDDWEVSLVGLTPKARRKKEKEREKEKREREEKRKEEEEAQKKKEKEEEEAQKKKEEEEEEVQKKKEEEEQKEADDWEANLVGLNPRERKKKERERGKEKKAKELEEQKEKERLEQEEKEKQEREEKEKQQEEERAKEKAKDDDWAKSLTPKEKKKKEKEREREKKEKERLEQEEKERLEQEEKERVEREEKERQEEEEKAAKEKEEKKGKNKLGKKGKTSTSPEASKTKDLLADSVPDTAQAADDDTWGLWGGSKKTKKGGKKDMSWEAPPPVPTPPAQGLTPEPEEQDLAEDDWGDFSPAKTKGKKDAKTSDSKAGKMGAKNKVEEIFEDEKSPEYDLKKIDSSEEDTPAKAARSFWGGMGATSRSKTSAKDASRATKDEEAENDVSDLDEIVEVVEEPAKKSTKGKTDSSDAKKKSIADDITDATSAKGRDGKSKKGLDTKDKDDDVKEDVFNSIWGSSKKTSGKKANEVKTEIGEQDSTNQKSTGKKGAWNEPEPTSTETDDQPPTPQPTKSSKTTMSNSKTAGKSSVLQRAKEFEQIAKASKQESAPPAADLVPTSKFDKKGALGKTSSKGASSKNKELSPEDLDTKKGSKDSVPGSFPGEDMDDLDMLDSPPLDSPPLEKQETKKSAKSEKESKNASKNQEIPESKRPPTPPPEPKEEKPVKKGRARVSKAGGPTSWGLWGAPTKEVKKETKAKDDAEIPPPPKKEKVAGLVRSKSTKTAKEVIKSESKDSESDKPEKVEKPKKAESRPPKSRGSSFGGLFGGPTARKQSVRRGSTTSGPKATSRQASVDQDANGLPSPPPEDSPEIGSKAAKLMGVGKLDRKASTRGKQKAKGKKMSWAPEKTEDPADGDHTVIPDPYAIDSDDMVMVNGIEDPVINGPIPKKGSKSKSGAVEPEPAPLKKNLPDRTRSKRDSKINPSSSKRKSKAGVDLDDDVVMVDAGPSSGADVADGPDDMQFITKPKGLQRSGTSAKKPEGKKSGGLFGGFLKRSDTYERPKKAVLEEEVSPRKRIVTGGNDSAKRPRREDRRRSEKTDRAAQGYVYDTAPDAEATEAKEADSRREERRAKKADRERAARDEALKYETDRRAKRREADKAKVKDDKDRRARKEEEAEAKRQEEKDARRAAREARRAKEEEEANRALEEDILKPRSSKRRDADKDRELPAESSSRPRKSDRRRSTYDKPTPDEDESRRQRHEERRAKAERRKSTAPGPVDDYFDPRNSSQGAKEFNDPYGGNEHTASWVKSQASDPPEPPPIEPSIVEPAPDLRATSGADDLKAEDDLRRSSHRKSKRSSRMYTDPLAEDQDRRRSSRRREKESEGSAEGERYRSVDRSSRRQSEALGGVKLGAGTKTFDGKTGMGKRSSWFNRFGGMS